MSICPSPYSKDKLSPVASSKTSSYFLARCEVIIFDIQFDDLLFESVKKLLVGLTALHRVACS